MRVRARECSSCGRVDFLATRTRGWPGPDCVCGSKRFEELGTAAVLMADPDAESLVLARVGDVREHDTRMEDDNEGLGIDQEDVP